MFDPDFWNYKIFLIWNFDIENKCSTICVCRILLQKFNIRIQKLNRNINISNISNLTFDEMCFSLEKAMMMTLCQNNQQSICFLKQPGNKIGANVMILWEGPAVNNKINKIEVREYSTNCTYLCFGWWQRRNVCPYCWKKCGKRKQQPWIFAVYRSLERIYFCKYLNNIQCESPAVRCRFW